MPFLFLLFLLGATEMHTIVVVVLSHSTYRVNLLVVPLLLVVKLVSSLSLSLLKKGGNVEGTDRSKKQ